MDGALASLFISSNRMKVNEGSRFIYIKVFENSEPCYVTLRSTVLFPDPIDSLDTPLEKTLKGNLATSLTERLKSLVEKTWQK